MTPPRQILPGSTYLITRRCSERRFFLRPSEIVRRIFLFVLAVAAARFGIRIHAYCVLSDHYHLVLTDTRGTLPSFQRYLDGLIARAVNAAIGHREAFWDRKSYGLVRLETTGDVLAKIVYVLANPVAAGLVRRGNQWPGLWSDPRAIGGGATPAERPEGFFRESGPLPANAELQLDLPPGVDDAGAFIAAVCSALEAEEDRVAASRAREQRPFLGTARVLAQSCLAHPRRAEPFGRLNPAVAGKSRAVLTAALANLRQFRAAYREAFARWRDGARDVVFPPGTWAMRVHHGARCAAAA